MNMNTRGRLLALFFLAKIVIDWLIFSTSDFARAAIDFSLIRVIQNKLNKELPYSERGFESNWQYSSNLQSLWNQKMKKVFLNQYELKNRETNQKPKKIENEG